MDNGQPQSPSPTPITPQAPDQTSVMGTSGMAAIPPKKSKKGLLIAGVVIVLALVGVGIFMMSKDSKENKDKNETNQSASATSPLAKLQEQLPDEYVASPYQYSDEAAAKPTTWLKVDNGYTGVDADESKYFQYDDSSDVDKKLLEPYSATACEDRVYPEHGPKLDAVVKVFTDAGYTASQIDNVYEQYQGCGRLAFMENSDEVCSALFQLNSDERKAAVDSDLGSVVTIEVSCKAKGSGVTSAVANAKEVAVLYMDILNSKMVLIPQPEYLKDSKKQGYRIAEISGIAAPLLAYKETGKKWVQANTEGDCSTFRSSQLLKEIFAGESCYTSSGTETI